MAKDLATPKLSVVMSVYNGGAHLRAAIDSILKQSFSDFEFIIINDGSTDDTKKIIDSYKDSRIRRVNQPNHGLVYSLNKAFDMARADIIARMDADDISEASRLEEQFKYLADHSEVGVVGCFLTYINESSEPTSVITPPTKDIDLRRAFYIANPIGHGSTMLRKAARLQAGGYRESFSPAEDYDLWRRIAKDWRLAIIPKPLYSYRLNSAGISSQQTDKQQAIAQQIAKEEWTSSYKHKALWRLIADGKFYKGLDPLYGQDIFNTYVNYLQLISERSLKDGHRFRALHTNFAIWWLLHSFNVVPFRRPLANSPRLRLLYVSSARVRGGGEVYLRELLRHSSGNVEQFLMCRRGLKKFFRQEGLGLLTYRSDPSELPRPLARILPDLQKRSLRRALRRTRPDLVVIQSFSNEGIKELQELCRQRDIPTIFTALTLFDPKDRQHYEGNVPIFNRFTAILSVCEKTRLNLRDLGVTQPGMHVISNGVDTALFKPATNNRKHVLWVGRVDELDKNAGLFLKIAELAQPRLNIKFRMVGEGPLLAKLKAEAGKRHIENISFAGYMKHGPAIYRDALALCLTSTSEAQPLNILEAMACGVPVISTAVGGIPEIITRSDQGMLLKSAQARHFVDGLEDLINDHEAWSRLSLAGRKRVEQAFDARAQYQKTLALFREVAK